MATLKYTAYETAFNRHIRNARKAATGLHGYERATAIATYFKGTVHPHVAFTFGQMAANRTNDRQFAIGLLNTLADLTAKNEEGYSLNGGAERWHIQCLVGSCHFNGVCVYRYALNDDDSKQLITVEHEGEVVSHATFNSFSEYERWLDSLGENQSGVDLVRAIHKALEDDGQ